MFRKIKKIIISVALLLTVVTTSVYATSLRSSTDKAVLYAAVVDQNGNASDWSTSSVSVHKGEILVFQIHAYANGGDISNLSQKLENINNQSFSSGSTKSVYGWVDASNASRLTESVNVNFSDNVRLEARSTYAWFVKREGANPEASEHDQTFPNGQNGYSVLDSDGVQLGSLTKDYRSNVLIYFDVVEANPAVNGQCGSDINVCTSGTFSDLSDTSTKYRWKCLGSNGGSDATCSKDKPQPAVNGQCGSDINVCTSGTFSELSDTSTQYRWKCLGSNGGSDATCTKDKPQEPEDEEAEVRTKTPTNVTENCATLRGYVDLNDEDDEVVGFILMDRNQNQIRTVNAGTKTSNGTFEERVCGLDPETKYYYQAYSDSDQGEPVSFTTEGGQNSEEAEITTKTPTNVTENCATLRGYVDLNDEEDERVYFRYGTSNSMNKVIYAGRKTSNGTFEERVCNLDPGVRYYYQAYSDSDEGSIESFRTNPENVEEPARVYTNPATSIGKYTATLNGRIEVNDTENPVVYFIYGDSRYNLNKKTGDLRVYGDTAFKSITGLRPNTTYYFQAIVKDADGIVDRGIIRSFTTEAESTYYTPVNGSCGSYVNKCARGTFFNIKDTATYYKWACRGYYGGKTAYCSVRKAVRTTPTRTNPTPKVKPVETFEINLNVNKTVNNIKNYEEKGLRINKWVSKSRNGRFVTFVTAKPGDTVFYKILVENNSDKTVDLKVEDFIPEELDDKDGTTADSDRYITWVLKLRPGERKVFYKEMIVDKNVVDGQIIDSAAKITMDGVTEDTNNVTIEVDKMATTAKGSYSFEDEVAMAKGDNGQKAEVFGSSLYPKSISDWIVIFGFLGLIIFGIYKVIVFDPSRK